MTPIEIRLLGGFQIARAGESVIELSSRAQALFANVLIRRTAPHSRQQLADAFWPESTDKQARTNLRHLILLLRRALPQTDDLLDVTSQSLGWKPRIPVWVDLITFEETLAHAPAPGPPRRAALIAATDSYSGDLLPDCYDEWVLPERERLRNLYAQALGELVLLAEAERDYPAAISQARRLLRHDPLHETTYRQLMRLLALTGNRVASLQTYHTCATLLLREIGVEPGPETQQLYAQLLQQEGEVSARPAAGVPTPTDRPVSQLVGRLPEWQTLQKKWRQANRGGPQWVLISGEAGMGKSRLAEEMLAWAERQAMSAAYARSYASTGRVSYSLFTDLLRNESLRRDREKLDDLWQVELSRLLPEINSARPNLPPPPALAEEWQKRRLFEALALACLGDGRARLLVLDDLHWADRESLEFLAFLLRYRPQARLLVVGTARSEEMLDNEALQIDLREAATLNQLTQFSLAPLTTEETGQLAGQIGSVTLDKAAAQRLHDDSGGNPLFVVEMVRAGNGEQRLATGTEHSSPFADRLSPIASLPPKIQDVITSRLDQLSPPAHEIAVQAAVLGRFFTYPVLAAACPLDEAALVNGLDELWRRRIVREVGGEAYDFSHDRIRDVSYGLISQARRRLLHRRAAEALLQVHAGELEPVQGQLGHHFASAGDNPAAIGHFRQAATVALERYAHAEAADYLSAAIALAESAGDAAVYPLLAERERVNRTARRMDAWAADLAQLSGLVERLNDGRREVIRRQAGLSLARHYYESYTGDRERALVLAQEALHLARSCGAQGIVAEALIRCANEFWEHGRFDEAQESLERSYSAAIAAGLPALAATSLELQAALQMFSGGSSARIGDIMSASLRLYREANDETGECNILNKLGYLPIAQGDGDYAQALVQFERGLAIGRRTGNQRTEMYILRNLVLLYTCRGEYRQARCHMEETQEIIERVRDGSQRNVLENYRCFWLLQQGRLSEAKAGQTQALARLQEQKQHLWMVKAITALGWIAFYSGDWEEAERRASEGIIESQAFGEDRQIAHSLTCRGWARLRQGRIDGAIPDFQRSAELLQSLKMANRAQEALAGLAQAAFQNGVLPAAQSQSAAVAQHLLTHPLDRTVDAFLAIHTCHAILRAAGHPLAGDVKALALAHLHHRAATIEPEFLDGFWAMPGHQEMLDKEGIPTAHI